MNDDKARDPKTDPLIPESERELDVEQGVDEPKTTEEHESQGTDTQDAEVNQNIDNDEK